jgi:hypothetical protein
VTAAVAAGNTVNRTTNNAAAGGFVQDVEDVLSTVEADGFDPRAGVAVRTFRSNARKARNTLGDRYDEIAITRDTVEIDGVTYTFPMRGQWPTGTGSAEAILFDPNQFVARRPPGRVLEAARPGRHHGQQQQHRLQPAAAGHGRAAHDDARRLAGREHPQLRPARRGEPLPAGVLRTP